MAPDSSMNRIPLTHAQQRVWNMQSIYHDTGLYNIAGSVDIFADTSIEKLEKALQHIIQNNDAFYIRIDNQDGNAVQYFSEFENGNVDYFDFSGEDDPHSYCMMWQKEESKKPFKFYNSPLYYFAVYRIDETHIGYYVKIHHIIADGWSLKLMAEQIAQYLDGNLGTAANRFSFRESIPQESSYLQSLRFIRDKNFWNDMFCDLPENLPLLAANIESERKTFHIPEKVGCFLKSIEKQYGLSLNMIFVAAYCLLQYTLTGRQDLIIGNPALGRYKKVQLDTIGMFVSSMPVRIQLEREWSIREYLLYIKSTLYRCYRHQRYPYDLLFTDLELNKHKAKGLYDTCVNIYNTKMPEYIKGGRLCYREIHNGSQEYNLQIVIREWNGESAASIDFDYRIQAFSEQKIEELYNWLMIIISKLNEAADMKLSMVTLLDEAAVKRLVYEYNNTAAVYEVDHNILKRFCSQVVANPDAVAVESSQAYLTYAKLHDRSDRIAAYLLSRGLGNGAVVGLLTEHSLSTVVAILGILKSGAAFLPLNPAYPFDYLSYLVSDASIDFILSNTRCEFHFNGEVEVLDLDHPLLYSLDKPADISIPPDALAYVLYTSGSTGKPKAVAVSHGSLANYIQWIVYSFTNEITKLIFPFFTNLSFDLTLTSLFAPLLSGGYIKIYPEQEILSILKHALADDKCNIIKLTPSHLSLLTDEMIQSAKEKSLIVGGEALRQDLAARIDNLSSGKLKIYNEYGPTEATVGCMLHRFIPGEYPDAVDVPIGRPIANVQVYLLDGNQNPVPAGVEGEIYISGFGLAKGYLNDISATHMSFIRCPFYENKKMYRTGDKGLFLDDGILTYLGRLDHQVKIRGYRVDLVFIEQQIITHPEVEQVVVLCHEILTQNAVLHAYYTSSSGLEPMQLKKYLENRLPRHMVPTVLEHISSFPVNHNGKIDREALASYAKQKPQRTLYAADSENEKALVQAISEVFMSHDVDVRDDFYLLGGDSIKAIQTASKLQEAGYAIKVKDILTNPMLSDMANYISKNEPAAELKGPCVGHIAMTPMIEWFFSGRSVADKNQYYQGVCVKLTNPVSKETLTEIMNVLMKHHDSFRINCKADGTLWYNNAHLDRAATVDVYDVRDTDDQMKEILKLKALEKIQSEMDICSAPLLNCCVFITNEGQELYLHIHHLAVDGISWQIILDDLSRLFQLAVENKKLQLLSKTAAFQKWSDQLQVYGNRIEDEIGYWQIVTKNAQHLDACDLPLPDEAYRHSFTIPQDVLDKLKYHVRHYLHTDMEKLMLTVFLRSLKEVTGNDDMMIELEHHGREDVLGLDISRTVGWFTTVYPFRVKLQSSTLETQIQSISDQMACIPHHGIGYGLLEQKKKLSSYAYDNVPRFNYFGELINLKNNRHFTLEDMSQVYLSNQPTLSLIEVTLLELQGKLHVVMTCKKDNEDFCRQLMRQMKVEVDDTMEQCHKISVSQLEAAKFEMVSLTQEEFEELFD